MRVKGEDFCDLLILTIIYALYPGQCYTALGFGLVDRRSYENYGWGLEELYICILFFKLLYYFFNKKDDWRFRLVMDVYKATLL